MPASWLYMTGDPYPFKVLKPADQLVGEVMSTGLDWLALPCEAPIDVNDEDAGSYQRTTFIRTDRIVAIAVVADAPGG